MQAYFQRSLLILLLILFFLAQLSQAETTKMNVAQDIPLSGFFIDQTVSPLAQQFALSFSLQWHQYSASEKVNVVMKEEPSARWGSKIIITVDNYTVFSTVLNRRMKNLEFLTKSAGKSVLSSTLALLRKSNEYNNPDLAPDEI